MAGVENITPEERHLQPDICREQEKEDPEQHQSAGRPIHSERPGTDAGRRVQYQGGTPQTHRDEPPQHLQPTHHDGESEGLTGGPHRGVGKQQPVTRQDCQIHWGLQAGDQDHEPGTPGGAEEADEPGRHATEAEPRERDC